MVSCLIAAGDREVRDRAGRRPGGGADRGARRAGVAGWFVATTVNEYVRALANPLITWLLPARVIGVGPPEMV